MRILVRYVFLEVLPLFIPPTPLLKISTFIPSVRSPQSPNPNISRLSCLIYSSFNHQSIPFSFVLPSPPPRPANSHPSSPPQTPRRAKLTHQQTQLKTLMISTRDPTLATISTIHNNESESPITSGLSSQDNNDGSDHGKKSGDGNIEDGVTMPNKEKVPAANVFWTDHLRML